MNIEQKWEELEKAFDKNSTFGAGDSEPQYHKEKQIASWFNGEPLKELSAKEWELFDDKEGAEAAAKELNEAMKEFYSFISKLTLPEVGAAKRFLAQKFWYCSMMK